VARINHTDQSPHVFVSIDTPTHGKIIKVFIVSAWCLVFSVFTQAHAGDPIPQTNWGGVFKVPVEKVDEVDQAARK